MLYKTLYEIPIYSKLFAIEFTLFALLIVIRTYSNFSANLKWNIPFKETCLIMSNIFGRNTYRDDCLPLIIQTVWNNGGF